MWYWDVTKYNPFAMWGLLHHCHCHGQLSPLIGIVVYAIVWYDVYLMAIVACSHHWMDVNVFHSLPTNAILHLFPGDTLKVYSDLIMCMFKCSYIASYIALQNSQLLN